MPPLLVEFTGLPGAGKTTITRAVLSELATTGYNCFDLSALGTPEAIEKKEGRLFSKLKTFYYFASSCVNHKRIALNVLLYALQVTPLSIVSLQRVVTLLLRLDLIKTMMSDSYDLIVLDQGLIQNIWSITATGNPPANNKYLVRLLKSILDETSPAIILVDVDVELAMERINHRLTMRSRFDKMLPDKAADLLAEHKNVFNQVVNCAAQLKGTCYLNVNGSRPIEKNVTLVVQFIERAWQTQRDQGDCRYE